MHDPDFTPEPAVIPKPAGWPEKRPNQQPAEEPSAEAIAEVMRLRGLVAVLRITLVLLGIVAGAIAWRFKSRDYVVVNSAVGGAEEPKVFHVRTDWWGWRSDRKEMRWMIPSFAKDEAEADWCVESKPGFWAPVYEKGPGE